MTLAEGAAAAVLAGQADRVTLENKRSEGQMLGRRPVDPLALADARCTGVDNTAELRVQRHMFGDGGHLLADCTKRVDIDSGFATAFHPMCGAHAGPASLEPVGLVRAIACASLEFRVEIGNPVIDNLLRLFLRHDSLGNQLVGINAAGCRVLADCLVHQRLGEHRLVAFIMTEPAIAEDIKHNIGAKGLAELDGDPRRMHDGFRIIAIHMEDRCHHHLRHIRRIG